MDTIKSYLDAMFASLPNTAEVRKARNELLQMMEDKYNELIEDGVNENTAVGTVISEFGNLDELAEDLGLEKVVEEVHGKEAEEPRRQVSIDEVKEFISNRSKKALFLSSGIMFCIISVASPILFEDLNMISRVNAETLGVVGMFLLIGLGIFGIIFSNAIDYKWKFLKKEPCQIDMNTASYVKERRSRFELSRALWVTIGIILCLICWLPTVALEQLNVESIGECLLFLLVGIGVFLIVYANKVASGSDLLLKLNDSATIAGDFSKKEKEKVEYVCRFQPKLIQSLELLESL